MLQGNYNLCLTSKSAVHANEDRRQAYLLRNEKASAGGNCGKCIESAVLNVNLRCNLKNAKKVNPLACCHLFKEKT